MDDLAQEMGNIITKQAIYKYEKAQSLPDSPVLLALSKALQVDVDYLFRPFTVEIGAIQFRKKSSLGALEIKALKEKIRDHLERYLEVENILNLPSGQHASLKTYPVASPKDVIAAARNVRQFWKLGEDALGNVLEILECQGIKVLQIDAPKNFDGLSSWAGDKTPFIVVNKNLIPERKRFTAMHELGHLCLQIASERTPSETEKLCHLFASEMLLPQNVFLKIFGQSRKDIFIQELSRIQEIFGISIDAMMHKANDFGIISDHRYQFFWMRKNKDPKYKQLVEKSLFEPHSTDRLERLTYQALANELISYSKAAGLLKISINTLKQQLVLA